MDLSNVKFNMDTELVLNVGYPMGKTNAPRAYNKLFSELGMNAIMLPVEIKNGKTEEFVEACKTLGIRYFSPTMPHKKAIIDYLDVVDESSRLFRSVNAVRFDDDGKSYGVGMDGKGAVKAIKSSGIDLAGKKAVMLGSGSISGVIGYELSKYGITSLTILNRTIDKAEEIANILRTNTDMAVEAMAWTEENLNQAMSEADLLLQLTPLGMAGFAHTYEYLGFIDYLPERAVVFDVIINPPDTPVIAAAKSRGLKTVPGMKMLAGQMEEIFQFMFGVKLSEENKDACVQELCDFLGVPYER